MLPCTRPRPSPRLRQRSRGRAAPKPTRSPCRRAPYSATRTPPFPAHSPKTTPIRLSHTHIERTPNSPCGLQPGIATDRSVVAQAPSPTRSLRSYAVSRRSPANSRQVSSGLAWAGMAGAAQVLSALPGAILGVPSASGCSRSRPEAGLPPRQHFGWSPRCWVPCSRQRSPPSRPASAPAGLPPRPCKPKLPDHDAAQRRGLINSAA